MFLVRDLDYTHLEMNGGATRKEIALQCGIARETRIFEAKDLATLNDLACGFVDCKVHFQRVLSELNIGNN